ncbi:MAG: asparagine synthase (glutamine-hydrolyzing) [Planctomycetes bacterium]|nr:asparagine synthase (glutamine-hydrolyzing) [Planctomycetota bacterium]
MCGLVGVFGPNDPAVVERMAGRLDHRGPDDRHVVSGPRFALGATRLSIIDVQGGRQPLANETGAIHAAQNGEIYNFVDLMPDLKRRGHRFASRTDTEVLVHLYEERGPDLVHDLQGMYAFAVWDDSARKGLLARDRVGKKPLYYWHAPDGALYFASEIKSILLVPGFRRVLEPEALHHFLSYKNVPAPLSIFQGIRQLPPGHRLEAALGADGRIRFDVRRYWRLDFGRVEVPAEPERIVDGLLDRLRKAVVRRLVSDVPIGFFLSGGVDSGMSTALAAQASDRPIQTFTLVYGPDSTTAAKDLDRECARRVSKLYKTDHHEEVIEFSHLEDDLPAILSHFDEPFAGVISPYYLSRLIARHVKVALSGDGADELFGSYLSHRLAFPIAYHLRERAGGGPAPEGWLRPYEDDRATLERLAEPEDWAWRYKLLLWSEEEKQSLYSEAGRRLVGAASTRAHVRGLFDGLTARDPLNRILEMEFRSQLPDQVLTYVDRLSMAHALEVRAPFLDTDLLEYAAAIPGEWKVRKGEVKYILKEAARRLLPDEVVFRKKEGFLMPINQWLLQRMEPYVRSVLGAERLGRHGLFDPAAVHGLLGRFYAGQEALGTRVFSLISFQLWFELYQPELTA